RRRIAPQARARSLAAEAYFDGEESWVPAETVIRGCAVTRLRGDASRDWFVSLHMPRLLFVLLAFLVPQLAFARTRVVTSKLDSARRILIITAHPDDELLLAPLLAQRCVTGGASCSFVVMTVGEGGGDGAVRAGEMARSAAMFNAR